MMPALFCPSSPCILRLFGDSSGHQCAPTSSDSFCSTKSMVLDKFNGPRPQTVLSVYLFLWLMNHECACVHPKNQQSTLVFVLMLLYQEMSSCNLLVFMAGIDVNSIILWCAAVWLSVQRLWIPKFIWLMHSFNHIFPCIKIRIWTTCLQPT